MTARPEDTTVMDRDEVPPRLCEGIDVMGEYEGSGYKEPHFMARRADGQVIQLTELLFYVADNADGQRNYDEIAKRVSQSYGKKVSVDNVRYLVEEKLRPLGVLAAVDGSAPKVEKRDPLLALRFKFSLVPERFTGPVTTLFKPLFLPPVIIAALAAFVVMDIWLWGQHGVGQSLRDTLYQPLTLLLVLGMVILSAGFHELGHATACAYGGARPGRIGAGLYLVWPAFYTDVTDAYRLDRAGRLRTDVGGVYFNVLFSLGTVGLYFLTGYEPLLLLVPIQHIEIVHQLLPFLRMDGYYILADLTGVPDLFTRIRPILRSLRPGTPPDPRVTDLKRWVRVVVTGWVLVIVPLLGYLFLMMVVSAPRILATAVDSMGVQYTKTSEGFQEGDVLAAFAGIAQLLALALPVLGVVYSIVRICRRAVGAGWRWSEGSPPRRMLVVFLTGAALGVALFTWWPNGEYRPIQKGERFVVQESIRSLRQLPTGRPGLPAEREKELGGAPTLAEQPSGSEPVGEP
ncbi:MAG: hypothetical protein KY458_09670, partial [Actinobacteria bacterium]|nr:hypothetical protein [Actinomycetota bacterium]